MASIGTHLQRIMSAVYGEEVRQSIHDGIKAINTEEENFIDVYNNSKQRMDDAIAVFGIQTDNVLSEFGGRTADFDRTFNDLKKAEYTTLWTRTAFNDNSFYKEDASILLPGNISQYDYIDVLYTTADWDTISGSYGPCESYQTRRISFRYPSSGEGGVELFGVCLANQTGSYSSVKSIGFYKCYLGFSWPTAGSGNSTAYLGETIEIVFGPGGDSGPTWEWKKAGAASSGSASSSECVKIMKIIGVKVGPMSNTEIIDARISNDGTTYDSLGAAYRGLESKVNSIVDVLINNLKTNFVIYNLCDSSGNQILDSVGGKILSQTIFADQTDIATLTSKLNATEQLIDNIQRNNLLNRIKRLEDLVENLDNHALLDSMED